MKTFCDNHGLLFVPSVGPGYDDTKIRPWFVRAIFDCIGFITESM